MYDFCKRSSEIFYVYRNFFLVGVIVQDEHSFSFFNHTGHEYTPPHQISNVPAHSLSTTKDQEMWNEFKKQLGGM